MSRRVLSLVPSLTESLILAGAQVVGRTRYCVHPAEQVKGIPIVGGTKQCDWQKVAALTPDLVVFDREENTREMAEACPHPWHATHVTSVANVGKELSGLARALACPALERQAEAWQSLAAAPALPEPRFDCLPGLMQMIAPPAPQSAIQPQRVEYLIWRNPWMAVGPQTFIGSVLAKTGFASLLPPHKAPYPRLQQQDLARPGTFYLFSSEPYPFARHLASLRRLGIQGALVDGEFFSWFGERARRLLAAYLDG